MNQVKDGKTNSILFVVFVAVFLLSFNLPAEAKKDNCPTRRPDKTQDHDEPIGYEELKRYVTGTHKVFVGEPVKTISSMAGFEETEFRVLRRYRGIRTHEKNIRIVHAHGKYENGGGLILVRARYGNDGNLYAFPMSCPAYYTNEEVISYLNTWPRAIFIFLIVLLTYEYCNRVLNRGKKREDKEKEGA